MLTLLELVLLTLCSKKCRKQNLLDDRKNPYTDEEYPDTKFDSVSYKEQVDIHVFNLFLSSSRMKFYNVERFQQGTAGITHHPQKPGHIALLFGSFPLLLEIKIEKIWRTWGQTRISI